jgi:FtsZ-binding cell division protein ZapB
MQSTESGPLTPSPRGKSENYKNAIIGFLSIALVCVVLFLMISKGKSGETAVSKQQENQQPLAAMTPDEEMKLRKSFDETLVRLDSLTDLNASLNTKLTDKNKEIADAKSEIRRILNSKNATSAELRKAKDMIESLNDTITSLQQEVAKLTEDNATLVQEKTVLTQQNEQLTQDLTATKEVNTQLTEKVDVGSTLNASNIRITPVKIRKNDKEKVTYSAKRVDKLMITFDVNNRIAEPGMKDLYVMITGPDGKLITADVLGSGTFTSREEGDKPFTTKVPVEIETAKAKQVEFSFKPGTDFHEGNYLIQIYQNGFKIGEGTSELKKGGLFG